MGEFLERRGGKPRPFGPILFLCLCAIVLSPSAAAAAAPPAKLSLLVVTIDTLRADHVGIYGDKDARTPVLDGLARRGVRFDRAFSHVPLTLPSHCTLFTGLEPAAHGVRDNGQRLGPGPATLAEMARGRGYATAAVVGAYPLDSRFGLARGFDLYDDLYGSRNKVRDMAFVERRGADVSERAGRWLRDRGREPFLLWVHYFDPHAPYEPPPPYDGEFAGREYDGEIAYADACLGRLLEALDQAGRTADTLIVVASDHGEGLGDHGEKTHGIFVYDATLRVPLIAAGPGLPPGGRAVETQVGLIDVLPTVLELLGWPAPKGLPGRSLVPLMARPDAGRTEAGRPIYVESLSPLLSRGWAPLRGLRTPSWKYIDAPAAELYDVAADPGETRNLLDERPEVARRLRGDLEAETRRRAAEPAGTAPGPTPGREAREKLRALGYVGGGAAAAAGGPRPDPKTMIGLDNLFSEAVNASAAGRLEVAAAIYEDLLRREPGDLAVYDYAAYNLTKMNKGDEAVRTLEEAVGRGLVNDQILAHLGLCYQEAGRLEESVRVLEKALALDPDAAETHNDLGVSLSKSGRIEEAVAAFRRSLALDPHDAMAANNLGNALLALKRYDEAAAQYGSAIALDDRLASARNGLAAVLYRQGRVEEAVKAWERCLEIEPDLANALYNLGRAYLRMGRKAEALGLFERYVRCASPRDDARDIEEVRGVIDRLRKEIRPAVSSPATRPAS